MEVVWVALIAALAAVVPQVLTWYQNRGRDAWERTRHAEDVEREERDRREDLDRERRLAEDEIAAANAEEARRAIVKFVDVAGTFLSAFGRMLQSDSQTPSENALAITAVAPVRTAATEATIALRFAGRAGEAHGIEQMLAAFDGFTVPTWRNLNDYALACQQALSGLRSGFVDANELPLPDET